MTKQSTAICPHCKNPVSEYFKTNKYWYSDYVNNPKKYKEEYIESTGSEEFDSFLDEFFDVLENNQLDEVHHWLYEFPDFTYNFPCIHCMADLYIGLDESDNITVSAMFHGGE